MKAAALLVSILATSLIASTVSAATLSSLDVTYDTANNAIQYDLEISDVASGGTPNGISTITFDFDSTAGNVFDPNDGTVAFISPAGTQFQSTTSPGGHVFKLLPTVSTGPLSFSAIVSGLDNADLLTLDAALSKAVDVQFNQSFGGFSSDVGGVESFDNESDAVSGTVTVNAIPEPMTVPLIIIAGAVGLLVRRRTRPVD